MKTLILATLTGTLTLVGCATQTAAPTGMKTGQFVSYACDGGKRLQARLADSGSSVRIRYEGGYELDAKGAGLYEGEGWKLDTAAAEGFTLEHHGKMVLKACKPA